MTKQRKIEIMHGATIARRNEMFSGLFWTMPVIAGFIITWILDAKFSIIPVWFWICLTVISVIINLIIYPQQKYYDVLWNEVLDEITEEEEK